MFITSYRKVPIWFSVHENITISNYKFECDAKPWAMFHLKHSNGSLSQII